MHGFRRRLILRIAAASPCRSSACDRPPACVMSCLSPREGSTGTWLIDSERAPFHGDAFRVTIASSNAPVPPRIRPYPPHIYTIMRHMPHFPKVGMYLVVSGYGKTYRTGRAGDLGAGIAQKLFVQNPMSLAFPRIALSALLAPYRWHGYGVSGAHHGKVRGCRRACERTPLRGRRRCAAGGRNMGYTVSAWHISVSTKKVEAVADLPVPTTQKEVRSFVQFCNFYARIIHHFSDLTAPLTALLRKSQPRKVMMTHVCLEAFETLKLRLISAPCLILPEVRSDATFTVATDASIVGIATVLL
jgi:hypothetical protein